MKTIEEIVLGSGVPAHVIGYLYLCESVRIVSNDRIKIKNVKKHVYSEVAKKYGTTATRVERDITTAIELGCMRSNKMYEYFYYMDHHKGKPTNKEYIATMANIIVK